MKKIGLIFILLFSTKVFAQTTTGGGGFNPASISFHKFDDSNTYIVDNYNYDLDINVAANSMFDAIIKYQQDNKLQVDTGYATSFIDQIIQKDNARPILNAFDNKFPAMVGIVNKNGSIEYVNSSGFIKDLINTSKEFEDTITFTENIRVLQFNY